ncbi:MAG: cupin domain-containing protein [Clostridiales bacterium]|nr:cupin domain-containing protein [Clostridiales bacterium]
MFTNHKDTVGKKMAEGVYLRVLSHGGKLMMTEVQFDKGGVGAAHMHPHEQISYIIEGKIKFTIGEEISVVSTGDSCYIPSNVEHGVIALTDAKLVDVFSPQREEFLVQQ